MSRLRVYLTGTIQLESGDAVIGESAFPGRQGRRAFAWLALHRSVPVARDVLAEAMWGVATPRQWEASVNSVVSKLRSVVAPLSGSIESAAGTYRLVLPPDAWVDVEAALESLDRAEGALRSDPESNTLGELATTLAVTRQLLLPGEATPPFDPFSQRLARARARALELVSDFWRVNGEADLAIEAARELVRQEPFRDSGHQRLMRGLLARGDRAEAVRAFLDFQRTLSDELGVDPAEDTTELYLAALRA